jgi:hypothetical protein
VKKPRNNEGWEKRRFKKRKGRCSRTKGNVDEVKGE